MPFPELPTVTEALGLKDYEPIAYFAVFAPAWALTPPSTPEALAQGSKAETDKCAKANRDAKIEPQVIVKFRGSVRPQNCF
jgi:hypothetical protein